MPVRPSALDSSSTVRGYPSTRALFWQLILACVEGSGVGGMRLATISEPMASIEAQLLC